MLSGSDSKNLGSESKKVYFTKIDKDQWAGFDIRSSRNFFSSKKFFPYKLRINIFEDDYTEGNCLKIQDILCDLITKYSTDDYLILSQVKHTLLQKNNVKDKAEEELQIQKIWKALDVGDKKAALSIAEKISDINRREKYLKGYLKNLQLKETIKKKIQQQQDILDSFYRVIPGSQFVLYLCPINFNKDMEQYSTSSDIKLLNTPEVTYLAQPIRLLKFISELELELRKIKIRPGVVAKSDSIISSYISFRQDTTTKKPSLSMSPLVKKKKLQP